MNLHYLSVVLLIISLSFTLVQFNTFSFSFLCLYNQLVSAFSGEICWSHLDIMVVINEYPLP